MPVNPKHPLDYAARRLLRHRAESAPAGLWDAIEAELGPEPKRRRPIPAWLWSLGAAAVLALAWGWHLGQAPASAVAVGPSHAASAKTPVAMAASALTQRSVPVAVPASASQSQAAWPSTRARSAASPSSGVLGAAAAATAGHASADVARREPMRPASAAALVSAADRPQVAPQGSSLEGESRGELAPTPEPPAKPLAPEEFAGYARATADRRAAYAPTTLAALPSLAFGTVAPRMRRGLGCPSFTPAPGRELRLIFFGGPRHDQRTVTSTGPGGRGYFLLRDSLETLQLGAGAGVRLELGAEGSGMFGGIGLSYDYYSSSVRFYGPILTETTTRARTDPNTGALIGYDTVVTVTQEVTDAPGRAHSFTFTGSIGYRLRTAAADYYVAAEGGYEVVTQATGANVGADAERVGYGTNSTEWVSRQPGLSFGARLGADIGLPREGVSGPASPLGMLVELSVRRTGTLSGPADPLAYYHTRVGGSVGLRYRF